MSRFQYPIHVEPVSTRPETVTESRWHQPYSEPRRDRVVKAFAVAMIASGAVISPWALTQPEAVTESRWHQPWSEPVRVKQGLAARHQRALTIPDFISTPEQVTLDKWLYQLSEPVRQKPGLTARLQQAPAYFVPVAPFSETVSYDRWGYAFSEPVRFKKGLAPQLQQTVAFVKADPFPEATTVSRWWQPLSEPVRKPKLLQQGERAFVSVVVQQEVITPDKWHQPLTIPVRLRNIATAQQSGAVLTPAFPFQTPRVDQWGQPFSEPKRLKRVPEGSVTFVPFFAPVEVITLDKWYAPLATPTPRRSLLASEQQFLSLGPYPVTVAANLWLTPFSTPQQKAKSRLDGVQPAFVRFIQPETITVDKWYRDFNIPTPRRSYSATLAPAYFQSNYLVPAPYVDPPMASWTYAWSMPVRLRLGLLPAIQSSEVEPVIPQPNPPPAPGVYTVSGLYVIDQFTDNTVVYDYGGGVSKRTN